MPVAIIESLDQEGRGIAHVEGKTIFIEGGLPGETVEFSSFRKKPSYEIATALAILRSSSQRVTPRCPHFGVCGGCSMQHLEHAAQAAIKQRILEDALWHLARLRPEIIYPAITGETWGYRYRARLSVRKVVKKGGVLVGFHERRSSFVADMDSCEVLPAEISRLLPQLRQLINGLSIADRLPQIELAIGDHQRVFVLRVLAAPSDADEVALREFASAHDIVLYLQSGGPDSVVLFHPSEVAPLAYRLPDFAVELRFAPTDFTQVNHAVNRMLVRRTVGLLAPQRDERIADMFCGLGNFTLPLAKSGAHVVGIEGAAHLVERARSNAADNGLSQNTEFFRANLFEASAQSLAALGRFDKMLIDPPREGATALVKAIGSEGPARIVYVSCNPATLARDAAALVHEQGYRLCGAGIANMFPHTSHVESIALFER